MIAYKFLSAGAVGPFTRFCWPHPDGGRPGPWVETPEGDPADGIHGCRPADLPYWMDDELWRAELDGDVAFHEYQLVARRGRLLAPVAGWGLETARAFGADCAERLRAGVLAALRDGGCGREADALAALALPEGLATGAGALADGLPVSLANLVLLVRDCAAAACAGSAAGAGYVAARAAGMLAGPQRADDAFEAERAAQASWLTARLALEDPLLPG